MIIRCHNVPSIHCQASNSLYASWNTGRAEKSKKTAKTAVPLGRRWGVLQCVCGGGGVLPLR